MLVLSRKLKQEILIGENIKITVLKIKGNTVRLGIEAPRDVHVLRGEIPRKSEVVGPQEKEVSMADFTVVFTNEEEPTTEVDLIPFEASKSKGNLPTNCQKGGLAAKTAVSQPTPTEVQFRDQLPKVLQHNRLKEIVNQLTSNH